MELKTWSPLLDLEREMRSMFDRYWPAEAGERSVRLSTDMHREGDKLLITVELPGIDPEKDLEVSVEGDVLTITGQKTGEREVKEEDRYLHERRYGRFERAVMLPDGVDPDAVKASYDQGILTIEIPIPEVQASATRTIPIRAGE